MSNTTRSFGFPPIYKKPTVNTVSGLILKNHNKNTKGISFLLGIKKVELPKSSNLISLTNKRIRKQKGGHDKNQSEQ